MRRYPFYFRLFLLAAILPSVAIEIMPKGAWRLSLMVLAVALFVWGAVLMYLRKTGKSTWNGPQWRSKLGSSAKSRRTLTAIPGFCAAWVPIAFLLNRTWGLTDGQLGFICGVPIGIALTVLVMLRTKRSSTCLDLRDGQTQQSGTE